jgi:uncharacterized protein (TIGR03663 family)
MRQRIPILILWSAVMLLASFLRLDDLSHRPMHADEATGARILAERLESGDYAFDPTHFHGPLLSLAAFPVARMKGEDTWAELKTLTLRLVPAIAGTLLVLTPLLWLRFIGQAGALAAAGLLATSPILVYYSRMFIHESLLALTALIALPFLLCFIRRPSLASGAITGMFVGLMWASKETFVITAFAWGVAALCYGWFLEMSSRQGGLKKLVQAYARPLMLLTGTAILTTFLFYTDFMTRPSGAFDAIRTFFVYETVAGHDKPFLYYSKLLLWPKVSTAGLWWEGAVALLAITAILIASRQQKASQNPDRMGLIAFLGIATFIQFLVYSMIAYKTPWLMLVPWAHACVLAACLFAPYGSLKPVIKGAAVGILLVCLAWQLQQSVKATGRFETDSRNPYAYVPTMADAEKLENWLIELNRAIAPETLSPIAVVGTGYWPLPWYLRTFEAVGYWASPDASLSGMSVIIAMPQQFDATNQLLEASHVALPRGLRRDSPVMVYLRKDIWNRWMEASPE